MKNSVTKPTLLILTTSDPYNFETRQDIAYNFGTIQDIEKR